MGRNDELGSVDDLKPVLSELRATGVTTNTDYIFNTDAAPFIVNGVPSLVLWTGLDKYNLLYHKASDTFDSVVKKDLDKDAAVVASTLYAIADNEKPFAAHLSDQQVADILKGNGHLQENEYLKAHALLP
jgi:carboxypeptidase Q